jgi:hypothetical protein
VIRRVCRRTLAKSMFEVVSKPTGAGDEGDLCSLGLVYCSVVDHKFDEVCYVHS